MHGIQRGRLLDSAGAPETGERTSEIARVRNVTIEQVLSGTIEPVGYVEPDDEWALVIEGSARLEIDGEEIQLDRGEWVLLPAGTPHRLLNTAPGTNWLTVKLGPERSA